MKRFFTTASCLILLMFATACSDDSGETTTTKPPIDGGTTLPGEDTPGEETPDDGIAESLLLIKSIENARNVGLTVSTYNYTGDKLKSVDYVLTDGADGTYRDDYEYSGNNIVSVKTYFENKLFRTEAFTYNANNQLESYTKTYAGEAFKEVTSYKFENDKTITTTNVLDGVPDGVKSTTTVENGNITKIDMNFPDGKNSSTEYTYDQRPNPINRITGMFALSIARGAGGGANNIINVKEVGREYKVNITYNDDKWPVTIERVGQGYNIQYFYN